MISKIDHVAIAVDSLEEGLRFWADALGLDVGNIETVDSEKVKVAFLEVGESRVELLEPTAPDSPVGKFLRERGGGIHHVTLEVADLPAVLASLNRRGATILGDGIRTGAGGRQVAFLHPRSTGGVLLELVGAVEDRPEPRELGPGCAVLIYLRDPSEKLWGVLRKLDTSGVIVEGIDLGSFDDWIGQVERGEESLVGPSVVFLPMSRVDKVLLDRSSGSLPSLAERFTQRLGRTVQQVFEDLASGSRSG